MDTEYAGGLTAYFMNLWIAFNHSLSSYNQEDVPPVQWYQVSI